MKLLALFFPGIVLLLASCSTTYEVNPSSSSTATGSYTRGIATVESSQVNRVSASPDNTLVKDGARQDFRFTIYNGSNKPFNFSTRNIQASFRDSSGSSRNLKVFSHSKLMQEVEIENSLESIATSLESTANTLNAANAGSLTSSGYSSGSSYSARSGGYVSSSGYSSSSTYDPYRAAQARKIAEAENQARAQQVEYESQARIDEINQTILGQHTLQPGESYSGLVRVDMPYMNKDGAIVFDVYAGRERHQLEFILRPAY